MDHSASKRERIKMEGKKPKTSGGQEALIREVQSGQETEEEQKINHCNYIQEHRSRLGPCK